MSSQIAEFDIHGVVGIRVSYATQAEAAKILKLLSPFRAKLNREPDIFVRFFDPSTIRYRRFVGQEYAAFDDEHFYLLRGPEGDTAALVPFDTIGSTTEVWYESQTTSAPLLTDIIRLTFLAKGHIPIHGSAFVYKDRGVLTTGWAKGGKTRTLLAFAKKGARFVSDDWVLLSDQGQMLSFPTNITLWSWQFDQIPELMPKIKLRKRAFIRLVETIDSAYRSAHSSPLLSRLPLATLGKALSLARGRLKVVRSPESVFGAVEAAPHDVNVALVVVSHTSEETSITACETSELIGRIVSSNNSEWKKLLDYYEAYKFAFPQKLNPLIEEIEPRQRTLLEVALKGSDTYEARSPYPANLDELFDVLKDKVVEAPRLDVVSGD